MSNQTPPFFIVLFGRERAAGGWFGVSPQTSAIVAGRRIVSGRGFGLLSAQDGAETAKRLFGSLRQSNSAGPSSRSLGQAGVR